MEPGFCNLNNGEKDTSADCKPRIALRCLSSIKMEPDMRFLLWAIVFTNHRLEVEVENIPGRGSGPWQAGGKIAWSGEFDDNVDRFYDSPLYLGSLGLSEFDGGLGQLSQRKHLLDFLSQEIKLEVFICFSPRWTWWASCSQCASSTRRRPLGSSWLTNPTTRSPPSSSTFSGPTIASVDFDPRLSQLQSQNWYHFQVLPTSLW